MPRIAAILSERPSNIRGDLIDIRLRKWRGIEFRHDPARVDDPVDRRCERLTVRDSLQARSDAAAARRSVTRRAICSEGHFSSGDRRDVDDGRRRRGRRRDRGGLRNECRGSRHRSDWRCRGRRCDGWRWRHGDRDGGRGREMTFADRNREPQHALERRSARCAAQRGIVTDVRFDISVQIRDTWNVERYVDRIPVRNGPAGTAVVEIVSKTQQHAVAEKRLVYFETRAATRGRSERRTVGADAGIIIELCLIDGEESRSTVLARIDLGVERARAVTTVQKLAYRGRGSFDE